MRITLGQLEAFLWIAHFGSFHQAADRLNISQPTISQRIQQFEAVIGVPLFERQGHRIGLNDHGRELIALARGIIAQSKRIETRFKPLGDSHGIIRLGLPESVAVMCLSSLMDRLAKLAPLLSLDVTIDMSAIIQRKLMSMTLDAAIIADPVVKAPIKLVPIGQNPLAWFAAPESAPAAKATPAVLARCRILTTPEFSHTSTVIAEWFESAGVQPGRITICNSLAVIARLICDGVGIGILPVALVQRELTSGALVRLPTNPPVRSWTLQAAYHTQGTGAAGYAIEAVVQAARQILLSKFSLL